MRFPRVELSEPELLDRIEAGYGPARRQAVQQELALLRQEPDGPDQIQRLLQPLTCSSLFFPKIRLCAKSDSNTVQL